MVAVEGEILPRLALIDNTFQNSKSLQFDFLTCLPTLVHFFWKICQMSFLYSGNDFVQLLYLTFSEFLQKFH